MGMAHYQGSHEYRRALDEFAIALKGMPNDADLWRLIGSVNRRLGNWDEVLAAFERARQLNPRNADLYMVLPGGMYQATHRYEQAARAFEQAMSLSPDLHSAPVWRGWMYVHWQGQLDTLRAALDRIPVDADLGGLGSAASQRAELLLWERDTDRLLELLRTQRGKTFTSYGDYQPSALFTGWAHQLRGDRVSSRAAFDTALVQLDAAMRAGNDDWHVHAARGLALAGLGRRDEALREASWLQRSEMYQKDAFEGPAVAGARARILAQAGEASAALDELERLLAEPSPLSVHTLRLDPRWDPIRGHARFQALLAKYSQP
jgi:tetratricopeptide (TPR) repeat protein